MNANLTTETTLVQTPIIINTKEITMNGTQTKTQLEWNQNEMAYVCARSGGYIIQVDGDVFSEELGDALDNLAAESGRTSSDELPEGTYERICLLYTSDAADE